MAKKVTGSVKLTGAEKVMKNLQKEIRKITGRSLKGSIKAVILIRRDMENTPPTIPVDLGNLRASWFTVSVLDASGGSANFKGEEAGQMASDHQSVVAEAAGELKPTRVVFGFTARYTLAVHENMKVTFKRPGSGPKFFESALRRNHKKIIKVIQKEAKI